MSLQNHGDLIKAEKKSAIAGNNFSKLFKSLHVNANYFVNFNLKMKVKMK